MPTVSAIFRQNFWFALLAASVCACGSSDGDEPGGGPGKGGKGGTGGSGASAGTGAAPGTGANAGSGGEVVGEGDIPTSPGDVADCESSVIAAAEPASKIPDYGAAPTLTSVKDGAWSDPSVWSAGRVPTTDDVVVIASAITYADSVDDKLQAVVIGNGGELGFSTKESTRLVVTTLQVRPGGALRVGTPDAIVPDGVTAEIVIADRTLDTAFDPEQFGHGLIVEGKVTLHGMVKTPFVRLAATAKAGATTLTLSSAAVGWKAGDRVGLPDTRHLSPEERFGEFEQQSEVATISAISSDGLTLTLSAPLAFDHEPAVDVAGAPEFFPHAANLSRNVVIRSENPDGTRGHALIYGRADADIRYVEIREMGRTTAQDFDSTTYDDTSGALTHVGTNQSGRYPLHALRLMGPAALPADGYQFKLVGNAVVDSSRWPITLTESHFGLLFRNVAFGSTSAGIVASAGNESYNLIQENFVANVTGHKSPRDNDARAGEAFYFKGYKNRVRANIGAGSACTHQEIVCGNGYKYETPAAGAKLVFPTCRGVDTTGDPTAQGLTEGDSRFQPILEFSGNEAYGAIASGMTIWHLNTDGYANTTSITESVIKDFRVWHAWEEGFFGYPIRGVKFDGFVVRGDRDLLTHAHAWSSGWSSGDYWAEDVTIINADIRGTKGGFVGSTNTPGSITIQDSHFETSMVGVSIHTLATPGTKAPMPARKTYIKNCTFKAWPISGETFTSIDMNYTTEYGNTDVVQLDEVFVEAYNGVAGDDFQLYFEEQAPDFIVPKTEYDPQFPTVLTIKGSPEAGLTNQQNWAKHGIAIAGAVSPTSEKRAGIKGLVKKSQ